MQTEQLRSFVVGVATSLKEKLVVLEQRSLSMEVRVDGVAGRQQARDDLKKIDDLFFNKQEEYHYALREDIDRVKDIV